jgi:hypothetical protein
MPILWFTQTADLFFENVFRVREADLLKCPTARITHLNICDSLPYYQPNTLAGAINNFFIAYPQKYENCSTFSWCRISDLFDKYPAGNYYYQSNHCIAYCLYISCMGEAFAGKYLTVSFFAYNCFQIRRAGVHCSVFTVPRSKLKYCL